MHSHRLSLSHIHTHTVVFSHWGRFGREPVRCRGDWAAWGSQTMFASTSGSLSPALTLFISPSLSLSLVSTSCSSSPLSLHLCRSLFLTHSALHLSLSLVPFISLALLFSSLHYFNTYALSLPLFFSPSLKSLAFLPLSLPPFKQQKAISLPLSGRLAVSP